MAIAIFLLYAADTSYRSTREIRVTRVKEDAESAFYAAEAGFNRVRARIIKQANHNEIMALHGRTDTLTYTDGDGVTQIAGQYTLQVESITEGTVYRVISTGTAGSGGAMESRRVVAGTITVTGPKPGGDKRTATVYDP